MIRLSRKRFQLFRFLSSFFVDNFVVPTRRLIYLLLLGAVIISIGFCFGVGVLVFWYYNGFLIIGSIIDICFTPKRRLITATRELPDTGNVHQPFKVALKIHNASGQPLWFSVMDDLPSTFTSFKPLNDRVDGKAKSVFYKTAGRERGKFLFSYIYLRYRGPLGLWEKQCRIGYEQEIKIFPDLSVVKGYLASLQQNLIIEGQRVRKRPQSGTEFHSLREYLPDDDPRMVNWTASARAGKIMTNVYQPERGKVITILLDCGRMMGVELDNQIKLDRTIEAALTLAAVALRQGDQVAILAFSSQMKKYVPPGKGIGHLHKLLEAVYQLKSDFVESNYQMALAYIKQYQKKRSLLVMFSDMESYLLEDQLIPNLIRIKRTHTPLLLSLKDPQLFSWTGMEVRNSRFAYIKSIARSFTLKRREYAHKVGSMGIHLLDVPADQLVLTAVNFYLELRSKDAL